MANAGVIRVEPWPMEVTFQHFKDCDKITELTLDQGTARQFGKDNKDLISLLGSIQRLLIKYNMTTQTRGSSAVSGGLQQFISRKLKQKSERSDGHLSWTQRLRAIYTKETPSLIITNEDVQGSYFQCLPIDLKLEIFSYLDSRSLCQACCVCQDWSHVTCDPSLWRHLLYVDTRHWAQVTHRTYPPVYVDNKQSDWSFKEIYLKCSPDFQNQLRASTSTFQHVSSVLRSFIPRRVPKVAMLGPGLESPATSCLVRRLLYEESQTFRRIAMFPGQFGGLGGGFTLKLPAGHSLHLSVLYSASKHERERRGGADRIEGNKLLQKIEGAQGEEESNPTPQYELEPKMKELCHTLDAFIFVVDASQSSSSVSASVAELTAMLRERQSTAVPVLVLSCVARPEDVRLPACDIVRDLNLEKLEHPWMVIDCASETLASVDTGFVWLVEQAQQR